MSPDGIDRDLGNVGIWDACDKKRAGMRIKCHTSGSLLRRRAAWRVVPQVDPGQPRRGAARAVIGETWERVFTFGLFVEVEGSIVQFHLFE